MLLISHAQLFMDPNWCSTNGSEHFEWHTFLCERVVDNLYILGMAIPRRISFLQELRSRGMTNLLSSGIEEYEIYSLGSSGNFEEWVIPKILKIPPKIQMNFEKNANKIQHRLYISKLGNNTKSDPETQNFFNNFLKTFWNFYI